MQQTDHVRAGNRANGNIPPRMPLITSIFRDQNSHQSKRRSELDRVDTCVTGTYKHILPNYCGIERDIFVFLNHL